jgi:hypothetical protein
LHLTLTGMCASNRKSLTINLPEILFCQNGWRKAYFS